MDDLLKEAEACHKEIEEKKRELAELTQKQIRFQKAIIAERLRSQRPPRVIDLHFNEKLISAIELAFFGCYGTMHLHEIKSIILEIARLKYDYVFMIDLQRQIDTAFTDLREGDILDVYGQGTQGYLYLAYYDQLTTLQPGLVARRTRDPEGNGTYLPWEATWFFEKYGLITLDQAQRWWPGIKGINDGHWEKNDRGCLFHDRYLDFPADLNQKDRVKFSFELDEKEIN
jgi:hypothetical protein